MARRLEIQGICHDLLESFVSRDHDLNGYWALGKFQSFVSRNHNLNSYWVLRMFQSFVRANQNEELIFDLMDASHDDRKSFFPQTSAYYRCAFRRHLQIRNIPSNWVDRGEISVKRATPTELVCTVKVTTDLGRVFASQRIVTARRHNPLFEFRRARV